MRKVVCTAITENYIEKSKVLLNSLSKIQNIEFEKIVITLDFFASKELRENYNYIDFIYQSSENIKNELTNIKCLQHGAFCDSLHLKHSDIVIFCDADILIQRDFIQSELDMIDNIKDNDIVLNYNNLSGMLLEDEINLLGSFLSIEQIQEQIGLNDISHYICYNTGFIIANFRTWQNLREMYLPYFQKLNKYIIHYAKQQWIISLIANRYFNPIIASQSLHSHCHHQSMTNILCYIDEKLTYNYNVVMFNHKCYELVK